MSIPSTNVDQKKLGTEFSIAISCPTGDKWQSKTLLVVISDLHPSIFKCVPIAAYPVWNQNYFFNRNMKNVN